MRYALRVWIVPPKAAGAFRNGLANGSRMESTMKRLIIRQWPDIQLPFVRTARRSVPAYYDHREPLDAELAESLESSRLKAAASVDSPFRRRLAMAAAQP